MSHEKLILNVFQKEDTKLRVNSIRALANLATPQDQRAIETLKAVLNDPDQNVAFNARRALDAIGRRGIRSEGAATAQARAELTIEKFRAYLTDERDPSDRLKAVTLVMERGARPLVPVLVDRLDHEKDHFVLSKLVKTIGVLGDAMSAQRLIPFLEHADARVRSNTIEGLAAHRSDEIFRRLLPRLEDSDHRVRATAIGALKGFKNLDPIEALSAMLSSGNPGDRASALYVLEKMSTPAAVTKILQLLGDPDADIRQRAWTIIQERGFLAADAMLVKLRELGHGRPELEADIERVLDSLENRTGEALASRIEAVREVLPGRVARTEEPPAAPVEPELEEPAPPVGPRFEGEPTEFDGLAKADLTRKLDSIDQLPLEERLTKLEEATRSKLNSVRLEAKRRLTKAQHVKQDQELKAKSAGSVKKQRFLVAGAGLGFLAGLALLYPIAMRMFAPEDPKPAVPVPPVEAPASPETTPASLSPSPSAPMSPSPAPPDPASPAPASPAPASPAPASPAPASPSPASPAPASPSPAFASPSAAPAPASPEPPAPASASPAPPSPVPGTSPASPAPAGGAASPSPGVTSVTTPASPSPVADTASGPGGVTDGRLLELSPVGYRILLHGGPGFLDLLVDPTHTGEDAPTENVRFDLVSGEKRTLAPGRAPFVVVPSPAGDRLALIEGEGGHGDLIVTGPDYSGARALTALMKVRRAVFVPDGSRLLVQVDSVLPDGTVAGSDIAEIEVAGTRPVEPRQLVVGVGGRFLSTSGKASHPAVSADGQWLIHQRQAAAGAAPELVYVSLTGSGETSVTLPGPVREIHGPGTNNHYLVIVEPKTGGPALMHGRFAAPAEPLSTVTLPGNGALLGAASAPRASVAVVVRASAAGAGTGDLHRLDLEGRVVARLTSGGADRDPVLSPDGRWLAFIRQGSDGPELRVMPLAP